MKETILIALAIIIVEIIVIFGKNLDSLIEKADDYDEKKDDRY